MVRLGSAGVNHRLTYALRIKHNESSCPSPHPEVQISLSMIVATDLTIIELGNEGESSHSHHSSAPFIVGLMHGLPSPARRGEGSGSPGWLMLSFVLRLFEVNRNLLFLFNASLSGPFGGEETVQSLHFIVSEVGELFLCYEAHDTAL
jgi:hypothetical protein